MAKDLVPLEPDITLPATWNYEKSVATVKRQVLRWGRLTTEFLHELWVAREMLSRPGTRTDLGANAPRLQTWGGYCKEVGLDKSTANRWLNRLYGGEQLITGGKKKLVGDYGLILADPPWHYDFSKSDSRQIGSQYPTMDLEDIKALPDHPDLQAVFSKPCLLLFLWATSPKLPECIEVVTAWGFTYKTCMVWVKDKIGTGYYARQQHELLLVGNKGGAPTPEPSQRPSSVIEAPRKGHSEKPVQAYEAIEQMYPDCEKLELFARGERKGWKRWGNEA